MLSKALVKCWLSRQVHRCASRKSISSRKCSGDTQNLDSAHRHKLECIVHIPDERSDSNKPNSYQIKQVQHIHNEELELQNYDYTNRKLVVNKPEHGSNPGILHYMQLEKTYDILKKLEIEKIQRIQRAHEKVGDHRHRDAEISEDLSLRESYNETDVPDPHFSTNEDFATALEQKSECENSYAHNSENSSSQTFRENSEFLCDEGESKGNSNKFHIPSEKKCVLESCNSNSDINDTVTSGSNVLFLSAEASEERNTEESFALSSTCNGDSSQMIAESTDLSVAESMGKNLISIDSNEPLSNKDISVEEAFAMNSDAGSLVDDSPAYYTNVPMAAESFVPYVDYSPTLLELVKLGVNLHSIQKKPNVKNYLIKLNFEEDIKPYLLFLKDLGIDDHKMGLVITKNPYLFQDPLEDIQVRINYLKSKKFTNEDIQSMVTKVPAILIMKVQKIDAKLGILQRLFKLSGTEVRRAVISSPRIIVMHPDVIEEIVYEWKEVMGFTLSERKKLLLCPESVLLISRQKLREVFVYAYNKMGLSHAYMVMFPDVLHCKATKLKVRHQFLMYLGKAQYDPRKENFVSMKAMCSCSDQEFCEKVAKRPIDDFMNFIKTL